MISCQVSTGMGWALPSWAPVTMDSTPLGNNSGPTFPLSCGVWTLDSLAFGSPALDLPLMCRAPTALAEYAAHKTGPLHMIPEESSLPPV